MVKFIISGINTLHQSRKVFLSLCFVILMASSIKIRSETKNKLDKLQAEILLKYNKKISQQDLIDILIEIANRNKSEIVKGKPVSKDQIKRMKGLTTSWKRKTSPDMLDDILMED